MSNKIKDKDIDMAGRVCDFMETLYKVDPVRYEEATEHTIPFGDLAYGSALRDWIAKGKPSNAYFSTARGQQPCPLLMAFRKEISAEFGLEILTTEEGEARDRENAARGVTVKSKKVFDWGPN